MAEQGYPRARRDVWMYELEMELAKEKAMHRGVNSTYTVDPEGQNWEFFLQ